MPIATINPATGALVKSFEPLSAAEVDARIAARGGDLPRIPPDRLRVAHRMDAGRGRRLRRRGRGHRTRHDHGDGQDPRFRTCGGGEVRARACRFFAANAERLLADEPADPGAVGATRAFTRYQPLGPVLAVMPWNFPLWQVVRFAAPALMVGQRRAAEARVERPSDRAVPRRRVPARRLPRGRVPNASHRRRRGGAGAARPRGSSRPRSPGVPRRASRSRRPRAARSRRPCSSSAAATRSSCCRRPTSTRQHASA